MVDEDQSQTDDLGPAKQIVSKLNVTSVFDTMDTTIRNEYKLATGACREEA